MKKDIENIMYGSSLRELRKKNHFTQERVAQLTGLEAKYISQIECGVAKGTINTMLKFCQAYNVTPNDLLHEFIKETKTSTKLKKLNDDIAKLNRRDKEVIISLVEIMLENSSKKNK